MPYDFNSIEKFDVTEGVEIVAKLVDKTDNLSSKFKGISFGYNLGKNHYDFIDEVYFFTPLPSKKNNMQIGDIIPLNISITKVYKPQIPDTHDQDRDKLLKIIVNCDCEYMRDGNIIYESQYEIVLA